MPPHLVKGGILAGPPRITAKLPPGNLPFAVFNPLSVSGSSATPERPYPDGYPSERKKQDKTEGGRFPSQIKKLPRLGGAHQPLASPSCIKMGHRSDGDPVPLPVSLLTSKTLSPSPVWINNSLPPCVDAIDEVLPIDSGTHHGNVGNRVSIPRARGKIFSQTIGKRKGASRAPF